MLHTSKADAQQRLVQRAGRDMSDAEIKEVQSHMEGIEDELNLYRSHEYLFRHVLRNPTVEGVSHYDMMQHLTRRGKEIIDLEGELNAVTGDEFREAYVGEVVKRLFGTSTKDLVGSINQGVRLKIPDDKIQGYAQRHSLDPAIVREAVRRNVIGAATYYGILSLYLESITKPEQRKILVDLIEETVNLSHQYKPAKVQYTREPDYSLKQLGKGVPGMIDFLLSFSPYDPMATPRPEATRTHTIAFESVRYNRSPVIEPIPYDKAKKIIEGNGSS